MNAPYALWARSPDGTRNKVVGEGASLPARGKVMYATSRAGQREAVVHFLEEERMVAAAHFELPPGLPPNTWLAIQVEVGADLRIRAEARENLRRIQVEAELDDSEREAEEYWV